MMIMTMKMMMRMMMIMVTLMIMMRFFHPKGSHTQFLLGGEGVIHFNYDDDYGDDGHDHDDDDDYDNDDDDDDDDDNNDFTRNLSDVYKPV